MYHRSIRDTKLALLHAAGGVFLQSQMYSQYLFALSYRPYNNGGFHEDKRRALELMLGREEPGTFPMFQDVWETIRDDLQMPPASTYRDVWQMIPTLPLYNRKGTLPKLSRWFSWNQSYEEQISSWNVLKLALGYHFQDSIVDDPDVAQQKRDLDELARLQESPDERVNMRQQFSKLKESLGGGLKLAYHLMSNKLLQMTHIIAMCTRPCWTWYSASVRDMKNPKDHLQHLALLASSWQRDPHLRQTAAVPTSKCAELVALLSRHEFSDFADTPEKVFVLCGHMLAKRAWSLSRAAAPPDEYAEVLLEGQNVGKEAGLARF